MQAATKMLLWTAFWHGADPTTEARATDPRAVLRATEAALRPAADEVLIEFGTELWARGQRDAAERVFAAIPVAPNNYSKLVRQAITLGQLSAAELLLNRWQASEPANGQSRLLRAALFQNNGQAELALRELTGLDEKLPETDRAVVRLQRELLQMVRQGQTPGIDVNPWNATFVDESGAYRAGGIAAAESAKIPPGTTDAMLDVIVLVPRQGNLWALLGELLNAAGEPKLALECFARAMNLLYTPPALRAHRATIEQSVRAVERRATELVSAEPTPVETVGAEPTRPADRPLILAAFLLGALAAVFLIVLQVREWRKAVSGKR